MAVPVVKIEALTKKYKQATVVDNLNLQIEKGEIFGLLGPNGAGKSTTIRMMMGMTQPSAGSVQVCGHSSQHEPIRVKRRVGYLPEDVGFYNHMTGFENLMLTARLNQIPDQQAKERVEELLGMVGLAQEGDKKAGAYSRGMKQRLGLADVLVKKPQVIILDEPTLGLDPRGMSELLEQIRDLSKNQGITVLFSSHHLHQVQHICDRVGLFVKGKLIASGDIESLSSQLFSESPVEIQAGVQWRSNHETWAENIRKLRASIQNIDGVAEVKYNDDLLTLACVQDVSASVAKMIIDASFDLTFLRKKEYGLNDIYNKYFEGGDDDKN
ncbi:MULTISPECIES: ABC transporter ATP-binding protein [unclassified Saccharicrinis]|uniref:ABC transporter ATP-binding protein n=1 Tax=unclassified Saccharicrinis TaxID=2646859 RepID=UPI003D355341